MHAYIHTPNSSFFHIPLTHPPTHPPSLLSPQMDVTAMHFVETELNFNDVMIASHPEKVRPPPTHSPTHPPTHPPTRNRTQFMT